MVDLDASKARETTRTTAARAKVYGAKVACARQACYIDLDHSWVDPSRARPRVADGDMGWPEEAWSASDSGEG